MFRSFGDALRLNTSELMSTTFRTSSWSRSWNAWIRPITSSPRHSGTASIAMMLWAVSRKATDSASPMRILSTTPEIESRTRIDWS